MMIDQAKIKNFIVNHFEKMILGVVVATSLLLIVKGFQKPLFTDEFDPAEQAQKANQVRNQIDEIRTETIIADRRQAPDFVDRTRRIANRVDPSPYKLTKPLEPKGARKKVRRQDPLLAAPRQIVTTPVVAVLAMQNKNRGATSDDYKLAELEPADPLDGSDTPRSRPNRRTDRRGGFEDLATRADDGERGLFDKENPDDRAEETINSGPTRSMSDEYDFGATARSVSDNPPMPQVSRFIAGTAVIPHRELYQAYEQALLEADEYSPSRDTPIYVNFEVQRADVSKQSVDQLSDEDWVLVWNFDYYETVAARFWAGTAPDIVPAEYRDNVLSNWIPPVLLDDYRTFVTHPLIPLIPESELEQEIEQPLDDEQPAVLDPFAMRPETSEPSRRAKPGSSGFSTLHGLPTNKARSTSNRDPEPDEQVEYKLLRFYDFVSPSAKKLPPVDGAKYVYRVRFAVIDPNFPDSAANAPRFISMAPEVANRVLPLQEEYLRTRTRNYQRWSPWSEPSQPVSLPALSQQFVGPVDPGSTYEWTVAGKVVQYAKNPVQAKVVTSQFDETYAARVPFLMEVGEGTVLSHQGDAEVVDPITMTIKKLPAAKVFNSTTVIDLGGGAALQVIDEMNEPGIALLSDPQGALIVSDEVADQEFFRIHSYADQREEQEQ
jgi:hypothetical protein